MYTHIERIYNTVGRNLGLRDYSNNINSWTEWAFEAELLIGSRDTFEEREFTYTSTGAQSTGTVTFSANPSNGDKISVNGVDLIFIDTSGSSGTNITGLSNAQPHQVIIGGSLSVTLTALVASLNGTLVSGGIPAQTTPGLNFTESLEGYSFVGSGGNTLTITKDAIGFDGNNFTLSSDNANAECSGSHLTGGKGIFLNQQLRLPDNTVKLLGVRAGTGDSSFRHSELLKPMAVHKERVGKDALDTQQKALRYYVSGNRVNIQHDGITEITIVCSTYPVDARGYPMIKDSHTTAVAQYIMWQHKNIDYINGRLSMYVVKDLEKRWYFLCGKARGDDNMPTAEELRQIGKIWNTMVPVKSTRGLLDL
jgi:hypothetical protein